MTEKAHAPAWLLYGILGLLVVNIALTLSIATREAPSTPTANTSRPGLPSALTKAERDRIFEDIQREFNKANFGALYDMFYDAAKVQIPKNEFIDSFSSLHRMFGGIKEGAYSHYTYEGTPQGMRLFTLIYAVKFFHQERGGGLKVRVIDTEEGFEIVGLFMGFE